MRKCEVVTLLLPLRCCYATPLRFFLATAFRTHRKHATKGTDDGDDTNAIPPLSQLPPFTYY